MTQKRLCTNFKDGIRELCLPECASFGVETCEKCGFIWGKRDREWFTDKLLKAQHELETDICINLCPKEICQEKVYLANCPITLAHKPIAYLGKKELVESRTLQICYQELSDCDADLPTTFTLNCDNENNDLIGTVFIENIPDGVTIDNIQFCYPEFISFKPKQQLVPPDCLREVECDGEILAVEAIWPKCHLVHPNCNKAKIESLDCFLTEIVVNFFVINEDLAVEIPDKCTCGFCEINKCTGFTIELGDPLIGEVCIKAEPNSCRCLTERYVYVNYATALNCDEPDPLIDNAIALLALIRSGNKKWCDCTNSTDLIKYWMEQDPSVSDRNATPFEGINRFPYGKTRAGVEVAKFVKDIRQKLIKDGILEENTGGFWGGLNRDKQLFRRHRRF